MPDDKSKTIKKKEYEKPELRSIELAADEVLAVGCKLRQPSAGPPNVGNRKSCIVPSSCFAEGS
jgi:hypothetical protein